MVERKHNRTRWIAPILAVSALALAQPAWAAPRYLPPDLDYKTLCVAATAVEPALDRDWTLWDGQPVATPPETILVLASEYNRGSSRLKRAPATGMRMLNYLETGKLLPQPQIDRAIARGLLSTGGDVSEVERRLLAALDGGHNRAALDLGELYGAEGPAQLRDPAKAKRYLQIAATGGDADALLALARLTAADTTAAEGDRAFALDNALIAMIGKISAGDCRYLTTIGFLYLNGDMVERDTDVASLWLEQYAETGDAAIQERLGTLLQSSRVSTIDFPKALDFMESAAEQGRTFAAFTIGKAYASGFGRTQDLAKAERFLLIGATGESASAANFALAQLYQGEFGGDPQPAKAKERYELALASNSTPDDITDFATFLANTIPGVADKNRALELLVRAASSGSGRAASLAADLYLDGAAYPKAEQFYRLGAELGRPESARSLAKMYACGRGVDLSLANANLWNERAYFLGSVSALFELGLQELGDSDATRAAHGRKLIKQAALKGYAPAIGYLIAQPQNAEESARLSKFVEVNTDADFKLAAELEIVKARLKLAASDEDVVAQYKVLDALIDKGATKAALIKADLLQNSGAGDPAEIRELLDLAAQTGDRRAMREYGELLLSDPQVKVADGQQWLQRAADAGDIKAVLSLLDTTAEGAADELKLVAAKGNVCSVDEMLAVARAFSGMIEPAAKEQAAYWLRAAQSIVSNDADDLYKIAVAYRDGLAGPKAVGDAEAYFERSASLGRATAQRDLAEGHLLGLWPDANPAQARELLLGLARGGDSSAATQLVEAIADQEIPADFNTLDELLKAGPNLSRPGDTYLKLARLDAEGAFGVTHPELVVDWLERSAAGGNPKAMVRLYRAYANGIGVAASPKTAIDWLLKAADTGDPAAAIELAAAYEIGFGVDADPTKAAALRNGTEIATP